ncbi:MAG: PAS domain S-box protein, partial [Desertifilum sp. SIO1I2]|nr:PAS domain S-box protein [Desertifilum sp. SIO1I2]
LQDPQLVEKGITPYLERGFAGVATIIPPIYYDPESSLPGMSFNSQPLRWVQGYIYPVKDEQDKIREVVLMHQDITQSKLAEEELLESESRFRVLIEATFDCIVIHERGIILEANQGTSRTFGYPLCEMIGRPVLDFAAPESRDLVLQNIQIENEEPYEAIGLRKDGTKFSIEVTGKPHIYKGRRVRVSALRDISKRKQLEAQLRSRAEELAEANRLKDEFLATLSHELRTPLNAMLGWAQMLRMRSLDEKMLARATETIERNTRSLAQLIEDLLDVSRIITGKLHLSVRPTSVLPALEAALETVRPAAEAKNIDWNIQLEANIGEVLGDLNRLQQVFWNLLANAVKFTPNGGRIQVIYQQVHATAQIRISDTGEGINAEFLPHVFERFRQADSSSTRSHGGLGLGLAIVRHLVELHGGTVFATSAGRGQGATFVVDLPLIVTVESPVDLSPSVIPADRLDPAVLQGIKILWVEDEADTRDLLTLALSEFGAEVTACANAREALAALSCIPFQLMLSDIGLPGEDGYSLMRQVRHSHPKLPALALTAYARAEDCAKAKAVGFQKHLTKPVDTRELVEAILDLVG